MNAASKKLVQVVLGVAVIFLLLQSRSQAKPFKGVVGTAKVSVEELLSYECARNVAGIIKAGEQVGPVFASGSLVFTSLEALDSSKILIVNAGGGIFSLNLEGAGVNRIRFDVPFGGKENSRSFYMTYLHGGSTFRSRFFDFSEGRPPLGKDELEYSTLQTKRAGALQSHLDFAIHETAEATLTAITEGRVARDQLRLHSVEGCEYLSRLAPNLARNLKHNLNMLEVIVSGPARRVPASMPLSR